MKKRHVFTALALAVLLTPVALSIGAFVLIPLALVLVPVVVVGVVAALPALFASALRVPEAAIPEDIHTRITERIAAARPRVTGTLV
jgi:hypothetical protein